MSPTASASPIRLVVLLALAALVSACATAPSKRGLLAEREVIAANMMRDITTLASDEFGGRQPGTEGERLTLEYLARRYTEVGLVSGTNDPANPWRAPVELVHSRPQSSKVALGGVVLADDEAFAFAGARRVLVEGADVVFVGRALTLPPADAIKGKVAVLLGEPGKSPARRAQLFELEPAAIITVVDEQSEIAGVRRAYGSDRIQRVSEGNRDLSAFVTDAAMARAIGTNVWATLREAAQDDTFAARALKLKASLESVSERSEFSSYNLIGRLPGTMPDAGAVLLLAHWDHLGTCGDDEAADLICNGAIDNASGVAMMLELARRMAASGPHDRDIYVLATSAEEAGLLGARAFIADPPVPLASIVAAFNFDTVAVAPAGSPLGFVGEGRTALDPLVLEALKETGRDLGNRDFAESFVQRQDGWALLEQGVPALFLSSAFGSQIVLGPYLENNYHQPSDELGRIELGGAIDDLLLHETLIKRIASAIGYSPPPVRVQGPVQAPAPVETGPQ